MGPHLDRADAAGPPRPQPGRRGRCGRGAARSIGRHVLRPAAGRPDRAARHPAVSRGAGRGGAQGPPDRGVRRGTSSPTWPTSTCSRTPTSYPSGATSPPRCATARRLDVPAMSTKDAIATAAAGAGIMIVPMSVARLHHRKDLVHRPVTRCRGVAGRPCLVDRQRGPADPDVHRDRPGSHGAQLAQLSSAALGSESAPHHDAGRRPSYHLGESGPLVETA